MIRDSRFPVKFLFVIVPSLVGCGGPSDGVPLHSVSGNVTFSGAAVPAGDIQFIAQDGSRTDGARITNGRYQLQTTTGQKRVEVRATREDTTNMVESAVEAGKMEPTMEMYIPEKYNSKSDLKAEVTAGGPNAFDFTLEP